MRNSFIAFEWTPDLLLLGTFVPFWLACYAYAIHFMWRALAPVARTRFNFYITDIWVGTLCLVPTIAFIADTIEHHYEERGYLLAWIFIALLSQVLGIVLARIFSFPREGEHMPRRIDQALWVVAGAYFFGVIGVAMIALAYGIVALIIALSVSCPPIGIWISIFLFMQYKLYKKTVSKPKAEPPAEITGEPPAEP